MLAVSLFENDTLTHLDLSYNSVTPSAALVFAFALKVRTHRKDTGWTRYNIDGVWGLEVRPGQCLQCALCPRNAPKRDSCFSLCKPAGAKKRQERMFDAFRCRVFVYALR